MQWRGRRESDNVDDLRGQRVSRGGAIGIGGTGLLLVVVLALLTGQNPLDLLGQIAAQQDNTPASDLSTSEGRDRRDPHSRSLPANDGTPAQRRQRLPTRTTNRERTAQITVGIAQAGDTTVSSIMGCTNYLISNGMPRAAYHVAYPNGERNFVTDRAMAELRMKTGRIVSGRSTPVADGLVNPYSVQAQGNRVKRFVTKG
jgi:hypothetical protein